MFTLCSEPSTCVSVYLQCVFLNWTSVLLCVGREDMETVALCRTRNSDVASGGSYVGKICHKRRNDKEDEILTRQEGMDCLRRDGWQPNLQNKNQINKHGNQDGGNDNDVGNTPLVKHWWTTQAW